MIVDGSVAYFLFDVDAQRVLLMRNFRFGFVPNKLRASSSAEPVQNCAALAQELLCFAQRLEGR